jgi:phage terminase small subunit
MPFIVERGAGTLTPNVVSWQWRVYPSAHRDRRNLIIHAVTVPLFTIGLILTAAGLARFTLLSTVFGVALVLGAIVAQGRGHRFEREAPQPFRSTVDALLRLVVEQFVTFPRFVLRGGFAHAWAGGHEPVSAGDRMV